MPVYTLDAAREYLTYDTNKTIEWQMDPNIFDREGNTPLHWAVSCNLIEVVEWLCERRGAMLTPVNLYGYTPKKLARILEHRELESYLERREELGRYCVKMDRKPTYRNPSPQI